MHKRQSQCRVGGAALSVLWVCLACGCQYPPQAISRPPAVKASAPRTSSAPPRAEPMPVQPVSEQPGVRETLDQIIIPSIEFREAPIEEVIEALIEISREADPDGVGVNIILMPNGASRRGNPGREEYPAAPATPKINLMLRNVRLYEALGILSDQAHREMRIRHGVICLYTKGAAPKQMEMRVYPVSPSLLRTFITRNEQ